MLLDGPPSWGLKLRPTMDPQSKWSLQHRFNSVCTRVTMSGQEHVCLSTAVLLPPLSLFSRQCFFWTHVTPVVMFANSASVFNLQPRLEGNIFQLKKVLFFFSGFSSHSLTLVCEASETWGRNKYNWFQPPHLSWPLSHTLLYWPSTKFSWITHVSFCTTTPARRSTHVSTQNW